MRWAAGSQRHWPRQGATKSAAMSLEVGCYALRTPTGDYHVLIRSISTREQSGNVRRSCNGRDDQHSRPTCGADVQRQINSVLTAWLCLFRLHSLHS